MKVEPLPPAQKVDEAVLRFHVAAAHVVLNHVVRLDEPAAQDRHQRVARIDLVPRVRAKVVADQVFDRDAELPQAQQQEIDVGGHDALRAGRVELDQVRHQRRAAVFAADIAGIQVIVHFIVPVPPRVPMDSVANGADDRLHAAAALMQQELPKSHHFAVSLGKM